MRGVRRSDIHVSAGGQEPKEPSRITYTNKIGDSGFIHRGRVYSGVRTCRVGRTVQLWGEGYGEPFATTETNGRARYRFVQAQDSIAVDYYTVVVRKEKPRVICRGAESKHKPLD